MWLDAATLVKPRLSKGGFAATAAAGLPFLLQPGMLVHFVPPHIDCVRQSRVLEARLGQEGNAFVTFEGLTEEDMHALAGSHCIISEEDARASADRLDVQIDAAMEGFYRGWTLYDEKGREVGRVVECMEHPTQLTLTVRDANGKEHLVPMVDELVVSIVPEERRIALRIAEGILSL